MTQYQNPSATDSGKTEDFNFQLARGHVSNHSSVNKFGWNTSVGTGFETSLASEVSHKLATEGIYSKVISMPCQRLFDQQSEGYKNKILNETELVVSIEASETSYWKKYTGRRGLNFGINDFGKSAPYKDIYDHFELNPESIIKKIKQQL